MKLKKVTTSKKPNLILLLIAVSVAFFYVGFIFMWLKFNDCVELNPGKFLTEYAKFLSTLTLGVLSFLALHVYWEKKKREYETNVGIQKINYYLFDLHRLLSNLASKLKNYCENNNLERLKPKTINAYFISNLKRIDLIGNEIIKYSEGFELFFFNNNLEITLLHYKDIIHPNLNQMIIDGNSIKNIHSFWKSYKAQIESVQGELSIILDLDNYKKQEKQNAGKSPP